MLSVTGEVQLSLGTDGEIGTIVAEIRVSRLCTTNAGHIPIGLVITNSNHIWLHSTNRLDLNKEIIENLLILLPTVARIERSSISTLLFLEECISVGNISNWVSLALSPNIRR